MNENVFEDMLFTLCWFENGLSVILTKNEVKKVALWVDKNDVSVRTAGTHIKLASAPEIQCATTCCTYTAGSYTKPRYILHTTSFVCIGRRYCAMSVLLCIHQLYCLVLLET